MCVKVLGCFVLGNTCMYVDLFEYCRKEYLMKSRPCLYVWCGRYVYVYIIDWVQMDCCCTMEFGCLICGGWVWLSRDRMWQWWNQNEQIYVCLFVWRHNVMFLFVESIWTVTIISHFIEGENIIVSCEWKIIL